MLVHAGCTPIKNIGLRFIPEKLTALREKHGWSQYDLALAIDCSQSNVYCWESGKSKPGIWHFNSLVQVFGCRQEDLAQRIEAPHRQPSAPR